jgi:hypothetical protein
LDVIVLKSTGPSIKEWYEGFEELRSIPHAFALCFANGEPPIMLFSDTAPEKVPSLLHIYISVSTANFDLSQDLLSGLLMTCP